MEYKSFKYKNIIYTITEIDKINSVDFYQTSKDFNLSNEVSNMSSKRRKEFICGRVCTRYLLNKLHYENINLPTLNTDGTPMWPQGIIGSISHTQKMIAVCICSTFYYAAVGIDIETIMNIQQSNAVIELTFNEPEFFENRPKSMFNYNRELYSTIIFSAKESIFKAIYQSSGCYFDFKNICLINYNNNILSFKIMSTISEKWCENRVINVYFDIFKENVLTLVLEN
ncbi:enterobactin synthetase component D [Gilliamella bombicola]|uniref:Enterobactin synthase component D n=1 Tax=Gilliamella bombicola TaxID=1798182 RepID=A0A1C3ZWK1_9GAMM|nr:MULTISPECIES: 4'-phosphopantetheinyl transferase superfamily protein [Gilliamella]MWP63016.1 4'-phosphopantetheinyl transferase superfamily protein [Gilliamella sp. Pas-s25]SCB86580.1 enterobactin synthetase component D [Gilliamella bombicola]